MVLQVALQAVQAVMMMTASLLDDQAMLDQANAAQLQVGKDWVCMAVVPGSWEVGSNCFDTVSLPVPAVPCVRASSSLTATPLILSQASKQAARGGAGAIDAALSAAEALDQGAYTRA